VAPKALLNGADAAFLQVVRWRCSVEALLHDPISCKMRTVRENEARERQNERKDKDDILCAIRARFVCGLTMAALVSTRPGCGLVTGMVHNGPFSLLRGDNTRTRSVVKCVSLVRELDEEQACCGGKPFQGF